jgi:dUTP pyrophosphatase
MEIKYTFVSENKKKQPVKATSGSAGFDLAACIDKPVVINPNQSVIIPTGIAILIGDQNYVGLVFARSGLAIKHGIALSNGVGVIDSDYTGEN